MKYSDEEIRDIIRLFEISKLTKHKWTHEAHLVAAIWYSSCYNPTLALNTIRQNIINHNHSVGTPNSDTEGYHETLTQFWLWVARKFLKNSKTQSISNSCNDFINSKFANRNYPLKYFSKELLFSIKARKYWVNPDLKNLE